MCFSSILQIKPLPYLEKIVGFWVRVGGIFWQAPGCGAVCFYLMRARAFWVACVTSAPVYTTFPSESVTT